MGIDTFWLKSYLQGVANSLRIMPNTNQRLSVTDKMKEPEYMTTPETNFLKSGRIGLAVMRLQPLHRGHARLLEIMRQDCDIIILGIGSTQQQGISIHPFSFQQRVEMLKSIFGDTLKPIPLVDIESQLAPDDWVDYVLEKARKLNLPSPTDYYTGSAQDAKWYVNRFAQLTDPMQEVAGVRSYTNPTTQRRLHVIERATSGLPSATEIRGLIEQRDNEWHRYVPARLINYIEWHYPPQLRVAIQVNDLPPAADYPVGTRLSLATPGPDALHQLYDDGKWRPVSKADLQVKY